MSDHPIARALLSVSDKTDVVAFAQILARRGVELISTGGTARALREAGLAVTEVADVTGAPEILGGRVKTLHPKIHGGLLADRDQEAHRADLDLQEIGPIDLLCSNLYPFERALERGGDFAAMIEEIDIGGPAMTRAAAKNHRHVVVVTDPADYARIAAMIEATGVVDGATRRSLAAKAFAKTAFYDAMIAEWFARATPETDLAERALAGRRVATLRYGENPQQAAELYARPGALGADLTRSAPLQGKPLSYNNLVDADAAMALAFAYDEPSCAIVKHASPCGCAIADRPDAAYDRALASDPTSAFGGVVAFNRPLDRATAERVTAIFTEVVIAPDADAAARAVFAQKANLRLLLVGGAAPAARREAKTIAGGFLLQDQMPNPSLDRSALDIVTSRAPSDAEWRDLLFAWTAVAHVKSNAVLIAADGATLGVGGGQPSRVDAAAQAVEKAGDARTSAAKVAASDAFFPFPDGLETLLDAGVRAVIQPGGAKNDQAVVDAADRAGAAMVFTKTRCFRH